MRVFKFLLLPLIAVFFILNNCDAHNYGFTQVILNSATTATITGSLVTAPTSTRSIDSYSITCTTKGNGAIAAEIILYAYNSSIDNPVNLATLYNSGNNADTTVIAGNVSWKYFFVTQNAISGNLAQTTCTMSY